MRPGSVLKPTGARLLTRALPAVAACCCAVAAYFPTSAEAIEVLIPKDESAQHYEKVESLHFTRSELTDAATRVEAAIKRARDAQVEPLSDALASLAEINLALAEGEYISLDFDELFTTGVILTNSLYEEIHGQSHSAAIPDETVIINPDGTVASNSPLSTATSSSVIMNRQKSVGKRRSTCGSASTQQYLSEAQAVKRLVSAYRKQHNLRLNAKFPVPLRKKMTAFVVKYKSTRSYNRMSKDLGVGDGTVKKLIREDGGLEQGTYKQEASVLRERIAAARKQMVRGDSYPDELSQDIVAFLTKFAHRRRGMAADLTLNHSTIADLKIRMAKKARSETAEATSLSDPATASS